MVDQRLFNGHQASRTEWRRSVAKFLRMASTDSSFVCTRVHRPYVRNHAYGNHGNKKCLQTMTHYSVVGPRVTHYKYSLYILVTILGPMCVNGFRAYFPTSNGLIG